MRWFAISLLLALLVGCQPGPPTAGQGTQEQGGTGDSQLATAAVSTNRSSPTTVFVSQAAFSPSGDRLLVQYVFGPAGQPPWGFKLLRLWDVTTGEQVAGLTEPDVICMALLPDGEHVLSESQGNPLRLWEAATGKVVRAFDPGSKGAPCLAVSRDGALALTGGAAAGGVVLWDVATGEAVRTLDKQAASAVCFSPDGKWAFASFEPTQPTTQASMWRISDGLPIHRFSGAEAFKYPLAISPDGEVAVSDRWSGDLRDKTYLVLWEVASGKEVRSFQKRETGRGVDSSRGYALAGRFSQDGKTVVTVDEDALLRLWSVGTGRLIWSVRVDESGPRVGAVSADGRRAFTACGEEVRSDRHMQQAVWDGVSGKRLHTLRNPEHR